MSDAEKIIREMKVREFSPSDREIIEKFFDSMGGESRALFNRRDYNKRGALRAASNSDPDRRYYLAEYSGKMIGYVFFLSYNTGVPEIGIAILDELRGMHLGEHLMNYAVEIAKKDGKGGIFLTTHIANVRAQALYEKLKFKQMGVTKNGTELLYLLAFTS